jgi:anti-sigma-K factor RskA
MDMSGLHPNQCGEDVAPYALGALTPEEARRFDAHLADCELCRADLATLRPVVDLLADTPEPVEPPPELRRNLMAVVEQEAAERRRAARGEQAPWWRALVPRPLPALAAACVLLVVGLGVGVALTGEDVREVDAAGAPPGVQAALRIDGDQGELVLRNMPSPRPGRVMQVWVMRGQGAPPEPTDALFTPNASGTASVAVPGDLDGVTRVLVSEEPRGGSRSPTTTPSLDFRLQSS